MNRSKFRTVFMVLILVACGAIVCFKIAQSQWTDASLEGQTGRLRSVWAFQRREAAANLGQFASEAERVTPELLKALRDPDREVRANALQSLKAIGKLPQDAAPVLVDVFQHDQDSTIRQETASLLGMTKVQSAAAALVEAIDDRDPGVRLAAMNALSFHGSSAGSGPAVDKLIAVIASAQPEDIRVAAIQTLGSIGRGQERVARYFTELLATDPSPTVRNSAALLARNSAFGFEIPAVIAALDDQSNQVRLTAAVGLAVIGLSDDRTVPALCRAIRKADDAMREAIGSNLDMLILYRTSDKTPDEQLTRRFQAAVREFRTVLETREARAREHVINVLGRVIAIYQKTGKAAFLEAARAAVEAVLARMEDEKEQVPLRLHALNQWSLIQRGQVASSGPAASRSAAPVHKEELHARSLWIAGLCRALKSQAAEIRSRAGEILLDNFNDPGTDPSFREAWRQAVPSLAKATKSEDVKVRDGALAILGLLGPEAGEALPTLRSLARDTQGPAIKAAAEGAIKSISSIDDLKSQDPALRIAAALTLGRLDWRATPALPNLIANLKDPETNVRAATVNALRALGQVSSTAVPALATALAGEPDAVVRVAILEALETIAPGTPPVLDAHLNALRDPDPAVRKAGASFQKVPTDDSVVSALETALGDSNDEVRKKVAGSLTEVLFSSSAAIPALFKALRDPTQRQAVLEALGNHLENISDSADLSRVPGKVPGLKATLNTAIPAIVQVLSLNNEEIKPVAYGLLGRIVSFSGLSRDADLRKAIEPALQVYLHGLDESIPSVREEVLGSLEEIPIRHADIVTALRKFLEKPDLTPQDRDSAVRALGALSETAPSKTAKGSRRG